MKIINIFLWLLIIYTISSCSSDNNDCSDILTPNGNEFTIGCDRYSTPIGRMNINQSRYEETLSCSLSFTNNENGNGFDFTSEDKNINIVHIWLIIKSNRPNGTNEIPSGTYALDKTLRSFSELNEFDIVDSNRVYIGAEIEGCCYENYEHYYGTDFDSITVNVSKQNNIYSINYDMIYGEKTIKGNYVGELELVDIWP